MTNLIRKRKQKHLERLLYEEDAVFDENYLVDFCDTQIYIKELKALREVYSLLGKEPEADYDLDKGRRIEIREGSLYFLDLNLIALPKLPESVGNWKKLTTIYLEECGLSSLPDTVGNWRSLQLIYICNNRIESIPNSAGNWVNLQYINVDGNPLTALPDSIVNWTKLKSLSLLNTHMYSNSEYIAELKKKLPSNCHYHVAGAIK